MAVSVNWGGPCFGYPFNKSTDFFLRSIWGPLILGNSRIGVIDDPCFVQWIVTWYCRI